MLLTREEMSFDFHGARLDPQRDRTALAWMMNQFLYGAIKQEERHVEFGERRTAQALRDRPALRRRLLGLSLVSIWAVRRLAKYMSKRLPSDGGVLAQLPAFLEFSVACAEKRLLRMGVLHRPSAEISLFEKSAAVGEAYAMSVISA